MATKFPLAVCLASAAAADNDNDNDDDDAPESSATGRPFAETPDEVVSGIASYASKYEVLMCHQTYHQLCDFGMRKGENNIPAQYLW